MPDARSHTHRPTTVPVLRTAAEAVSLVLVAGSPWLFAGTSPAAEFILTAVTGLLAALWALNALITRRLTVRPDLPSACLAGLLLLSAGQLVPLPEPVVRTISPTTADWHRSFRPETTERLADEPTAAPRSDWLPLSVDPFRTRRFLCRVAAVLLVYLVVRNWLAGREAFRRLAWVCTVVGAGLALLAVAQFFSGPRNTVYWTFPTDGLVFGPFVCKNHFPDYAGPCLGLAVGLAFTVRGRTATPAMPFDAPGRMLAGIAAVTMAASLPLSLSRGGVLAALVAGVLLGLTIFRGRSVSGRGLAVAGLAAVGVGLGGYFGWEPVEARVRSMWAPGAADARFAVWRDVLGVVPGVPLFGTGGGTFPQVEPLTHAAEVDPLLVWDHAHNEYVEAAVEGGLLRLILTVGLAVGLLRTAWKAVTRTAGRSTGPLAVGGLFGILLLVAHSVVDFAPHTPAVSLLAAALAGQLAAAAYDPGYLPQRVRVDREGRTTTTVEPVPEHIDRGLSATGPFAWIAAAGLVAVGLVITWDAGLRAAGDRFRQAVVRLDPDDARIAAARGWVAATPGDVDAHLLLAQVHFDTGRDAVTVGGMAIAGAPAGLVPGEAAGEHLRAGLVSARAARDASPLTAAAHAKLGRYAAGFASADTPRTYYERAKRANPTDPFVRLAAAAEAAKAGDRAAAVADWQAALGRSPRLVKPVLAAARKAGLEPDRMVSELLPPDPLVLMAAADALYPPGHDARRPFVVAAAKGDGGALQQSAAAAAAAELGQADRAIELWEKAIDTAEARQPFDALAVREAFVKWLEAEERYERAVPILRGLRTAYPQNAHFRDRLAAAEHAIRLEREIAGQ